MAEGVRPRVLAARAVAAVVSHGRSLDAVLAEWPGDFLGADRALARMLAYGTLRDHRRLGALLAPRLKKQPQALLDALLRVGLFQLEGTRIPAHAAVHATVAASPKLGLGNARGMVNAVLRGHQREPAKIDSASVGIRYSVPDWLADAIQADWGTAGEAVLAAGNARAPMHVRVNARRIDRDTLRTSWAESGIRTEPIAYCRDGLTLAAPATATQLPGFDEGRLSIQDGAAQLAADLVAPEAGHRVLDACAAPGNKSAHLLERADIELTALDIDADRLATLNTTLDRLGLAATTKTGDAAEPADWWNGQAFDRILLDAPCSGTGVIRRHPDIKWLRRASDIQIAAARQRALLAALWPLLAPGGRLVYATCSILRAEGTDVIADFMESTEAACERPINTKWGEPERIGRRVAPGKHGFDGFYYAVLEQVG